MPDLHHSGGQARTAHVELLLGDASASLSAPREGVIGWSVTQATDSHQQRLKRQVEVIPCISRETLTQRRMDSHHAKLCECVCVYAVDSYLLPSICRCLLLLHMY